MSDNPYAAPSSDVGVHRSPQELEMHDPRGVDAARGIGWISEGFGHFKQAPGTWIGIGVLGALLMVVVGSIPFLGPLNNLLIYVWIGGLMLGCKAQDDGEGIRLAHLIAGFQNRFVSLLLLGVIAMVAGVVISLATFGEFSAQLFAATLSGDPADMEGVVNDMSERPPVTMLLAPLLMCPFVMLTWFAPLLIVLNDSPVIEAMRLSFAGCLKNIVPFLLYGIAMFVLFIVAAVPLGLGFIVLMPTLFGSMYRSYKEVYIEV